MRKPSTTIKYARGCLLLALVLLFVSGALAQSDRGAITGRVIDASGAVVASVPVIARNAETGTTVTTETTATGDYTIPSLPAGTYDIGIKASGFKTYQQTGVRVMVAQSVRVDVTLEVGQLSESVEVSAQASQLKTESAEQSTTVSREMINELPLQAGGIRNPFAFTKLTPGANWGGSWGSDIRFNGTPSNTWSVRIDGISAGSSLFPQSISDEAPAIESMQEFTLQTSNFSAEYGQVGAGLINMTTRSGTNQFHGSVYTYIVNEAFNAGQPYTTDGAGHHLRPKNRQWNNGGNIGGPIRIPKIYDGTNRTFFYFNLERWTQTRMNSGTTNVPSEAMRNGDFSWLLTGRTLGTDGLGRPILDGAIYDPATDRVVNGKVYRDVFPGNVIPKSRFDAVAQKIQSFIPAPNVNTGNVPVNNYQAGLSWDNSKSVPSVKIDHSIGAAIRLSGYYGWLQQDVNTGDDLLPDTVSLRRILAPRTHTISIGYDHTITPTLINHLGVGMKHYRHTDGTPNQSFNQLSELGLKGGLVSTFPQIRGAFRNWGSDQLQKYKQDNPNVTESLMWVRGKHMLKFGGEWGRDAFTYGSYAVAMGYYGFDAAQTGLPATQGQGLSGGTIGYGYASFLLGNVNYASIGNPVDPQWRRQQLALYAQDTWRINSRLTLDYGLRWDYQQGWHEMNYRMTGWSPETPNPSAGGLKGGLVFAGEGSGRTGSSFGTTYPWAFGPRLGVAYKIDSKTVLRGGLGVTYAAIPPIAWLGGGAALGHGYNTFEFSTPAYGMSAFQLANGLSYDPAALTAANYNPGLRPLPGQINDPPALWDQNMGRPPRLLNWSIGIQREITKDIMIEAAYVGNRGAWWKGDNLNRYNSVTLEYYKQFGLDPANSADDRALLTSRMDSPAVVARGFKAPYASFPMSATLAQALRPYPMYNNVNTTWAPLGNTWYDSLQAKVTKRMSYGLTALVSYTFSKSLGTVDSTGGPSVMNNVFNRKLLKSINTFDRPHDMSISVLYEVPTFAFAKKNWATKAAFSGWSIGGLLRYASGTPINSPASQNALNSLVFQTTTMNRVPGEPLFLQDLNCHSCWDPNKNFVLNPKAWANPAPGQWGTAAARYSDYRYARQPDEQFNAAKDFAIRERMSLSLRFELFNAFNRMRYGGPDSGNPLSVQRVDASGVPVGGFGYVNATSAQGNFRTGQLVVRLIF